MKWTAHSGKAVRIISKVRTRAISIYLLVAVAVLGMGVFVVRYVIYGARWASPPYSGGVLTVGVVTDRNGIVLADVVDGRRVFADNADIRRSTLHAVGDLDGNVGTGALTVFASELMGYNLITGSYSMTGASRRIALTIDANLNAVALRALDGRNGVVMVSNYETGEVLVMVSSPTFDPANPPATVDTPALEGVYVNRAIQSAFTPGSTFKLVTAAAALEQIDNIHDRVFECTGQLQFGADTLICHSVHGTLGIRRGMQVSCNIVYGKLAIELGADTLERYAERLGLSVRTSVGGINTARGNFDRATYDINLAWSGVGQYTNTVCPASMLRFVGAIANEGNAVELQLRKREGITAALPARTERILSQTAAAQLSELIEIQNRQNFPGLELYAKTGTAQVGGGQDPHAWFVGYITNEDFPLAFVVMVENGGGGAAVAAPIANRVLQAAIAG